MKDIENSGEPPLSKRPATTPAVRETELVSLAVDLAEKQLRAGTATSQVITHYLKLATEREKLERDKLFSENELLQAKVETLKSQKRMESVYEDALRAMKEYGGS